MLRDLAAAPRQGDEGAPDAEIVFEPAVVVGARDMREGAEVLVFTWLHLADRDELAVHPRGDPDRPVEGVFSTRSPNRPNPIGLHRVQIISFDGATMQVRGLEALDGTPVIDVKPVLDAAADR